MSNGDAEMAALAVALDLSAEEEIELGEWVGKVRARKDRAIRDQQAAELLPLGWRVVAERFDVSKATVYNMNQRARSKRIAAA
jgi:hypothetical protein